MSEAKRLAFLGQQLRCARKRRGLRLRHVARALGVSVPAVQAYETGDAHIRALRLVELADFLRFDLGRLARRRQLRERRAA